MANNSGGSSGISFAGLLTICFIVLKLTHYIDWSWWWVLSPLWISALVGIIIIAIIFGFFGFFQKMFLKFINWIAKKV